MSTIDPTHLEPSMIGKLVTVQVYPRIEMDSDELDLENVERHVGVIDSYHTKKNYAKIVFSVRHIAEANHRFFVMRVSTLSPTANQ